jgi:BirA family transcriptional regulator, biotin operon repressor / biotin---[acetyl-CoA-carboxylase] ligase
MIPTFFHLKQLSSTESTNAEAKRAAEAGEAEGLVVQALRQTAGRGRQGRAWESPEGNLYMSVLLRPRCSPQEAGLYSFVAALAVCDAVRAFLPEADIKLKWPNDVLVGGKKISGILLEAAPVERGVVDWLVVGIGVNILHHPEGGLYPATSLAGEEAFSIQHSVFAKASPDKSAFRDEPVQTILTKCLQSLDHWRRMLLNEGFGPVREAWMARAKTGLIEARLPHDTVLGEFDGLDVRGSLILRLPDGTKRAIAAGDVFFGAG